MTFSPMGMTSRVLLAALAVFLALPVEAAQLVRIGAAHFPPLYRSSRKRRRHRPAASDGGGLEPVAKRTISSCWCPLRSHAGSMISSRAGSTWRFSKIPNGVGRMCRTPRWTWGLEDAEVFVAQRQPDRQQTYFADLRGQAPGPVQRLSLRLRPSSTPTPQVPRWPVQRHVDVFPRQ